MATLALSFHVSGFKNTRNFFYGNLIQCTSGEALYPVAFDLKGTHYTRNRLPTTRNRSARQVVGSNFMHKWVFRFQVLYKPPPSAVRIRFIYIKKAR